MPSEREKEDAAIQNRWKKDKEDGAQGCKRGTTSVPRDASTAAGNFRVPAPKLAQFRSAALVSQPTLSGMRLRVVWQTFW